MELEPRSRTASGLRRYAALVSDALGQTGDAYWVHAESPATVYVPLDERVPAFPDRDLALLWDERHGWCGAIETASGEDLIVLSYLGVDILPPPRTVARFTADLVSGSGPGQAEPPAFRVAGADDDLVERLAGYSPAPDLQPI
ncbi:DUF6292 family protein [Actinophytocola gossypii]|uniref:DUF6292 domain-containing protein n=1 Tax=Actinophytocola gossypii TaxID=2812003 RepID=A0ABT2J9Z8_9PSEU|nr:DUF6292 family protein [Actinophytocola gossypii]MCT2584275.1 hypothetical protein [Actinophytocola gossypii]